LKRQKGVADNPFMNHRNHLSLLLAGGLIASGIALSAQQCRAEDPGYRKRVERRVEEEKAAERERVQRREAEAEEARKEEKERVARREAESEEARKEAHERAKRREVEAEAASKAEHERARAFELYESGKILEAIPMLEKLATDHPTDAVIFERWACSIATYAETLADPEARKQTRVHALQIARKAKALGDNSLMLRHVLDLPEDGSEPVLSTSKEVDVAMRTAAAAFIRGDLENAPSLHRSRPRAYPVLHRTDPTALHGWPPVPTSSVRTD